MTDSGKLAALLNFVTTDDRVCPRPIEWNELWQSLPNRRRTETGWEPALPLVLAGWGTSTNEAKAMRLREHLNWARQHDGLDAADKFLRSLPPEAWHHSCTTKPNY